MRFIIFFLIIIIILIENFSSSKDDSIPFSSKNLLLSLDFLLDNYFLTLLVSLNLNVSIIYFGFIPAVNCELIVYFYLIKSAPSQFT